MKKNVLLLALALGALSCVNDRTCTVTSSENSSTETVNVTSYQTTKGQARVACAGPSQEVKGETITKTCKLN